MIEINKQIPVGFDPLENIADFGRMHRNIANIPSGTDYLLRWFPNRDSGVFIENAAEAQKIINLKREHFAFLRDSCHLIVPEHKDFIGIRPGAIQGDIAIYTLVEKLPEPRPLMQREDLGAEFTLLRNALIKYHAWVISSNTPAVMHDIFHPQQYCLAPSLTLLDIDPLLSDSHDADGNPSWSLNNCRQILDDDYYAHAARSTSEMVQE